MGRFLAKLALFVGVNIGLQILVLALVQSRYRFRDWETESVLLTIPKKEHFDLVFLGSSHGRIFSRDHNHQRVEAILGRRFLNLSKGGGGGVIPERIYLSYFFDRGNTADEIVYFIDGWSLASRKWNEGLYFLADEPFRLDILPKLLANGISLRVLLSYYKSKFVSSWFQQKAGGRDSDDAVVQNFGPQTVRKHIEGMYLDGFDESVFNRYALELEKTLLLSKARGANLVFVVPATLLGREPGTDALNALLRRLRERHGTAFYDLSDSIHEPAYYSDPHHLNTNGVAKFTRDFLRPALARQ